MLTNSQNEWLLPTSEFDLKKDLHAYVLVPGFVQFLAQTFINLKNSREPFFEISRSVFGQSMQKTVEPR